MIRSRLVSIAMATLMAGSAPLSALAGQAQTAQINAAEGAYQQALKDYAATEERAHKAFTERKAAREKYRAEWQAYWAKRQAAEKAHAALLDERRRALDTARSRITDAELMADRATAEEESAKVRLLSMLRAQSVAEKGTDKILARNLEARADELRMAYDAAVEAARAAQREVAAAGDALDATTRDFEARLDVARASMTSEEELDAIEASFAAALDAATAAPTDEALNARALEQTSAGAAFLALMLQVPPPFVERVTVHRGDEIWYDASYVTDESGSATADPLGQRGYRDALALAQAKIASADDLIAQAEKRLAGAREAWEEASEKAGEHALRIHLRNRDMLIFVLAVESTGVVLSAALTGGAAAPAVSALARKLGKAGLEIPAQAVRKLPSRFWTDFDAGGIATIATEAIQAGIGKHTSMQLAENPNVVPYVNDLNGVESTVVGDVVEMLAKDGIGNVRALISSGISEGRVPVDAVTNVSIDAVATAYKAFAQSAVNHSNALSEDIVFQKTTEALLAQRKYSGLVAFRNALITERERLAGIAATLGSMIELGLHPRKRQVAADSVVPANEAEQIAERPITVTVRFSEPLEHTPKLAFDDPGVRVGKPVVGEAGPSVWEFPVTRFDIMAGADTIPMEISLSSEESPYSNLDSNPATPPRLASLNAYDWTGYERGTDRNHAVRLAPASADVLLIDIPSLDRFGCHAYREVAVGEDVLEHVSGYYDFDRGQPVPPFADGEILSVCTQAGANAGEAKHDAGGRLLAIGWGDADPGYSNGYFRPTTDFFKGIDDGVQDLDDFILDGPSPGIPELGLPSAKPDVFFFCDRKGLCWLERVK